MFIIYTLVNWLLVMVISTYIYIYKSKRKISYRTGIFHSKNKFFGVAVSIIDSESSKSSWLTDKRATLYNCKYWKI